MRGKRDRDTTAAGVAGALADPLRLLILRRLLEGPVNVAELVAASGASQPNVSNHLALLRRRGLVAGPTVGQLVEALSSLTAPRSRPTVPAPIAVARTCYDHLAGRLGVAVLQGLQRTKAVGRPGRDGAVDLGPHAERVFARLGVDLGEAASARRRFAFACLDWTERQAHLGGSLGASVCAAAVRSGWIVRQPRTRVVLLSAQGRRGFQRILGISIPA